MSKNRKKPVRQLKTLSSQDLQQVTGGSGYIPGVRGNGGGLGTPMR